MLAEHTAALRRALVAAAFWLLVLTYFVPVTAVQVGAAADSAHWLAGCYGRAVSHGRQCV